MKKFKIIWQDIVVIVALGVNTGARFLTNVLTTTISAETSAANQLEANPVERVVLTSYALQLLTTGILFGIMLAFYLYLRKRKDQEPYGSFSLNVFTMIVFMTFFLDFLNDAGILLGILLH